MKTALLSAALLLLLVSGIPAAKSCKTGTKPSTRNRGPPWAGYGQTPISVLVTNSLTPSPNMTYSTYVAYRGILLGGLKRLQASTQNFRFTYTEDPNYGPFLQSVNGVSGSTNNRTYWELLVNTSNSTIRPDVGIGCYIPNAKEQIILKYTKY